MIKHHIIFKAIVGSQAYGLATETSDTDIKGIYVQSNEELLQNGKYEPFITVNKDECYYELRNFLSLLAAGNPTAIELLATPVDCVLYTSQAFEKILKYRQMFITQKLYDSFGGYALTQLNKAKGLDKKFNWEASRIEKKDILDFCKVLRRDVGRVQTAKEFIEEYTSVAYPQGITQELIGLTKVDGFRDTYKIYVQPSTAQRYNGGEFETIVYRGIMKEGSNEVRTSVVPKHMSDLWFGSLYFNREAYSTHCRDYKSYKKWKESRNETRYKESREGQQYDSKNIMHTARLIMTIENIHDTGMINIDMSNFRTTLLNIKHGDVDLEEVFNHYSERAANISELKKESTLSIEVKEYFVNSLELSIRKMQQ